LIIEGCGSATLVRCRFSVAGRPVLQAQAPAAQSNLPYRSANRNFLPGKGPSLPAEFPDKYEAAIVRAVEQCSVKRHLHQPPDFKVTLSRPLPD